MGTFTLTGQGYTLLEYATLEEAKDAIAGAIGKKILDQPIYADFAFVRGPPKSDRGNRFASGGREGGRRGRSQSPVGKAPEEKNLEFRIES